jgi:Fumarylacetoacetate (FAA) hydrolase family
VQHTGINDLIFDIPTLVSYCSDWTPLVAGDVISTGTPERVGFVRKPPLWMKPGDVVEVEIHGGLGALRNPIIAESWSRSEPMKAILLRRTGDPSALECVEVPTPRPGEGEVLVKADTIGVSMPEVLVREGVYAWRPPLYAGPGIELTGTIVERGRGSGNPQPTLCDRFGDQIAPSAYAEGSRSSLMSPA